MATHFRGVATLPPQVAEKTRNRARLERLGRSRLSIIDAAWPPAWRDVRDQVRNVRKAQPYMTPETFSALMRKIGVTGEEAQKDLAGQLHHLGEILYFQERDELSSVVILDPEWVTELIALVVRSKQVREHNGILRKADLDHLDSQRPPLQPKNGGLRRHIIDDGRLLWLCPEHKKLYQPRAIVCAAR